MVVIIILEEKVFRRYLHFNRMETKLSHTKCAKCVKSF